MRPSNEVGQRRFWNAFPDTPGIMWCGSASRPDIARLYSDTGFDEPLSIFNNGPITFPPEHKLARTWGINYSLNARSLGSVDYDGTGEWIFKPYSTKWGLQGPNSWMQGDDWETANLFYDSSPFAIPTTLKYHATGNTPKGAQDPIAPIWVYNPGSGAQGWGAGGMLYGYDNDVYFGNNEMGGNKPNVGVGPKIAAVGDLSKRYGGLWGAFGLSHGVCINAAPGCFSNAQWEFDLCYRPQMAFLSSFNNQVSHLNEEINNQTVGWGTEVVALINATVEFLNGTHETYRQFTVDTSPARSTINVYTLQGKQLAHGIDYIEDDCDKSGRSYRLIDTWEHRDENGKLLYVERNPNTNPVDACLTMFVLVVTYLLVAGTLTRPVRDSRILRTDVSHNRLGPLGDIRGL